MNHFDQAFLGEHREMEARLEGLEDLTGDDRWDEATEIVMRQKAHLVHHIDVEERIVYPAFEEVADAEGRRTLAFLRKRHQELPVFFDELADAVAAHDHEGVQDTLETLLRIVADHHATEERDVFPLFEPQARLQAVGERAASELEGAV